MICYKDKSYCDFHKECEDGKDCPEALTDEVQDEANKWWKSFNVNQPAPIMIYAGKPMCFKNK